MEVLTPQSLEEALALKAERPDAVPIQGGTDLMVELNFDRARPETILNLNEVAELRGWTRENGTLRLASGLTYAEAMEAELAGLLPALAEASRTVGSPQIRARGTIGGNLGTASPAGDALPPLLVEDAEVELASAKGTRTLPVSEFLVGPKKSALADDELIVAVRVTPVQGPADVHEGRPAERHGDRRLLAGAVRRPRAGGDPCGVRLRRPGAGAGDGAALGVGELPRAGRGRVEPDRRRARHRRVPPARAEGPDGPRAGARPHVRIDLTVNGEKRDADVWAGESLLYTLREQLGLPGSKNACEQGECGSCSVLLDGKLVCACLVLAAQADGHEVVTVEGLAEEGQLHRVQEAFAETGAVQCGFCTPGLIVATVALLEQSPEPTEDEIREALSGNLCRCTGYAKIFDAVRAAAAGAGSRGGGR